MKSYLISVPEEQASQVVNALSRVGDVAIVASIIAIQTQSEYDEVKSVVLATLPSDCSVVVAQTIRASGHGLATVDYFCRLLTP